MKRIMTGILTMGMVLTVSAGGVFAQGAEDGVPEVNQFPMESSVMEQASDIIVHMNDRTSVYDSVNDGYFEGTAGEGVEALLNAGRVSINGFALPATEEETEAYQVNQVDSLVKIDGSWGSGLHKSVPEAGQTFEAARHSLVDSVSRLVGGHTTFYLDESGKCILIDISSCDGTSVIEITENGGTYQVNPGDFTLENTRDRIDIRDISFEAELFDADIQVGDLAYYWYDPQGWHIAPCTTIEGMLTLDGDGGYSDNNMLINGEPAPTGSGVERYYVNSVNRPTQFYQSYENLDLGYPAILWLDEGGYNLGMTYGTRAKEALADALEKINGLLAEITASENGEGLEPGTKWAKSAAIGRLQTALDAAQEIYDTDGNYETALGKLGQALGCGVEGRTSGFMGSVKTAE